MGPAASLYYLKQPGRITELGIGGRPVVFILPKTGILASQFVREIVYFSTSVYIKEALDSLLYSV